MSASTSTSTTRPRAGPGGCNASSRRLDDHAPRFVHFGGHGGSTGALILKTADVRDITVIVEHLRQLFAEQRVRPDLVVFATCHSRDLAAAVAPHVGHAIGFTGPLDDRAAPAFSAVLYERLAAHDPPDIRRAFRLARLAAVSAGFPEVEQACLFDHTGAAHRGPARLRAWAARRSPWPGPPGPRCRRTRGRRSS